MATIVCFHAHPDDEVIATGGLIARAAAEGHRVVLVVATNGDHGESPDDLGAETLVERRRRETAASAGVLGIQRVVWLGYTDSGMTGWPQNDEPGSFWRADVDEAARRLAEVLREEHADVLTVYDWHGNYGHPDHVQVHRVGVAAGALVPAVRVLETTMNRDHFKRVVGDSGEFDVDGPADDGNPFGMPEADLTLAIDVTAFLALKREAMRCHRSQITDSSFFLEMPDEAFAASFGIEWYIEHDRTPPFRTGWILDPA